MVTLKYQNDSSEDLKNLIEEKLLHIVRNLIHFDRTYVLSNSSCRDLLAYLGWTIFSY